MKIFKCDCCLAEISDADVGEIKFTKTYVRRSAQGEDVKVLCVSYQTAEGGLLCDECVQKLITAVDQVASPLRRDGGMVVVPS